MRMNLYIRDEDQPIIDKCREMLEKKGDSLSRLLVRAAAAYAKIPLRDDVWAAIDKIERRLDKLDGSNSLAT